MIRRTKPLMAFSNLSEKEKKELNERWTIMNHIMAYECMKARLDSEEKTKLRTKIKKQKKIEIAVISRVERSEADGALIEICESVTINGKAIEIPQGCTASITHIHKTNW